MTDTKIDITVYPVALAMLAGISAGMLRYWLGGVTWWYPSDTQVLMVMGIVLVYTIKETATAWHRSGCSETTPWHVYWFLLYWILTEYTLVAAYRVLVVYHQI